MTFQLCNKLNHHVQLGSKHQFCGMLIPTRITININNTLDQIKPRKNIHVKMKETEDIAQMMKEEYLAVINAPLGCVRHNKAGRMRFKREVPENGRKQADFSKVVGYIVGKQI